MKRLFRAILAISAASLAAALAQEMAPPSMNMESPKPEASPTASASATSATPVTSTSTTTIPPVPTIPPDLPDVPELSKLDEAFKQTSLGKAADENRIRIECRRLQNQIANEPAIVTAKKAAEEAPTDLEKRDRLREFYNLSYGRMEKLASSAETRKALEEIKAEHLKMIDQPRVRPVPGGTIPPVSKKEKAKKQNP